MKRLLCHSLAALSIAAVQAATPALAQQVAQQNNANPAPAAAAAPVAPIAPLTQEEVKYLDQLLNFWSQQTASIERYRCDFERWTYDSNEVKDTHARYGKGVLRYMTPDRGLIKVEDVYFHQGKDPQGNPKYGKVAGQFGEWWLCDGTWLHNYDRTEKKVRRYELPPGNRGVDIFSSPLPFLFGIEAERVKQRFWMKPIAPPNGPDGQPRKDIYAIEAYPKQAADAVNYQKVRVFLDQKEFLPLAIEIFLPDHRDTANAAGPAKDSREVYQFSNREKNWNFVDRIGEMLKFKDEFIPTDPPQDWQVENHPYQAAQQQQAQAPANQAPARR